MYHSGNEMVDPAELLDRLQIQPSMSVADLGCGRTGHLVFPLSTIVGERGIVYAVDIQKDVLETIHKRAAIGSLHNIHTVWSDCERIGKTAIPAGSLDAVLIVNTLVQCENRHGVLEEAWRLLKDKARLLVVDWSKTGLAFGPEDSRFVDFEDITRWSQLHGFAVQEEFEVGPYHRGLILFKAE